ncbi:hypothetical protein THAOC_33745 [Thalassiosira oceanica]|uniref:Uncharacterized protein n=1 Tax=Thalassiosira oceanica TaxID=159749 RepID=K0R3M9_THAOC|nr:hypothetical protein THAOC_33745 [Thalassiosira oceanica]|eukprot:EJK47523.1 hypothetical protein THAOC_33745 [Thalassiosira oceanica]
MSKPTELILFLLTGAISPISNLTSEILWKASSSASGEARRMTEPRPDSPVGPAVETHNITTKQNKTKRKRKPNSG